MNQVFLNALTPSLPVYFYKQGRRPPYEQVGDILVSYFFWRSRGVRKYQPDPTKTIVFGDSGGYSIAVQKDGTSLDPTKVVRWQIDTCSRGCVLDVPPFRHKGKWMFHRGETDAFWKVALARTVANVNSAFPYYEQALKDQRRFAWWGVVQGESTAQMHEWWSTVSEAYSFTSAGEGWALKLHPPNDLRAAARMMRFAQQRKIRRVHFLGMTALRTLSVIMSLGQLASADFDEVTYDSASATRTAISRALYVEGGSEFSTSASLTENTRKGESTVRDYMRSGACACVGCEWYAQDAPKMAEGDEFAQYILVHNTSYMRRNFTMIEQRAKADPHALLRAACGDDYGAVVQEWEGTVAPHEAKKRPVSVLEMLG